MEHSTILSTHHVFFGLEPQILKEDLLIPPWHYLINIQNPWAGRSWNSWNVLNIGPYPFWWNFPLPFSSWHTLLSMVVTAKRVQHCCGSPPADGSNRCAPDLSGASQQVFLQVRKCDGPYYYMLHVPFGSFSALLFSIAFYSLRFRSWNTFQDDPEPFGIFCELRF